MRDASTMAICRRCAECRKMFTPAPSARETQRVCSKACRTRRDRKLARARRRLDLDDAQADERERQRARRARLPDGCHAPPSVRKCPISPMEMRSFVDRAFAQSRATLARDLRVILLRFVRISGEAPTLDDAMSRATLGAQPCDTAVDCGANLAGLSRVTLGDRGLP